MNKMLLFLMLCVLGMAQMVAAEVNVAIKKYGTKTTHESLIDSNRTTGVVVETASIILAIPVVVSKFYTNFTPTTGKFLIYGDGKLVMVVVLSGKEDEISVELSNFKLKTIEIRFVPNKGKTLELREVEVYTRDYREIEEYLKIPRPKFEPRLTPVDPVFNVSPSR